MLQNNYTLSEDNNNEMLRLFGGILKGQEGKKKNKNHKNIPKRNSSMSKPHGA